MQTRGLAAYLGLLHILGNLNPILLLRQQQLKLCFFFSVLTVLWILVGKWGAETVLMGDEVIMVQV